MDLYYTQYTQRTAVYSSRHICYQPTEEVASRPQTTIQAEPNQSILHVIIYRCYRPIWLL